MSSQPADAFQGEEYRSNLPARHRSGWIWHIVFQASTVVGVVALTALLYNIVINAFGLAAIQNEVDPASLVLATREETMLAMPNLVSSEDDHELARGIADNPYAIGFFGYAYYQEHADQLRLLAVDGVAPSEATVDSGEYGLARPLFIYSTAEIIQQKPEVAAFLDFYLNHVNEEIADVGYFPAADQSLERGLDQLWAASKGVHALEGEILTGGSSTVHPLSQRMAERFEKAGFSGILEIDSIGSTAGFRRFCVDGKLDVVNASRAINATEQQLCVSNRGAILEFRVGTDALAVVVSRDNDFLTGLSTEHLQQIFTAAEKWSDVDPDWPDEPIVRFIPGADSGTLDFFAETIFDQELADLSQETLVSVLQANVSRGLFRRFESELSMAERTQEDVYNLVAEWVVKPQVVQTWSLVDSLFRRSEVLEEASLQYPSAELEFVSWINSRFVRSPQSSEPEKAGVRTAILGSLWTIAITIIFAFPLGVGAAIYLEEYASDNWLNRLIRTNINNLAGVPSIIYGMLGLAIFVRLLEPLSSGTLFGLVDPTTANGRTIFSAGLTLGLLILPLIIINSQEAIRAVPNSFRQASYGLGATKWQTIWNHVLPSALPGILTGAILAISRAVGETAPLVVVGASTFITVDPTGPFSKFTTLPIQIYQWTARPQDEFRNIAAAAIIVLLALLLTMNATAVFLRSRYSRRI